MIGPIFMPKPKPNTQLENFAYLSLYNTKKLMSTNVYQESTSTNKVECTIFDKCSTIKTYINCASKKKKKLI